MLSCVIDVTDAQGVNRDSTEVPPNLPGPYKAQRAVMYEDLGAEDVERLFLKICTIIPSTVATFSPHHV